jgi:hypothetical protein
MTPDMQSMMRERQEKLAELDQSYGAKSARAMETLNRQLAPRIMALRLIGPSVVVISPKHQPLLKRGATDFVIGNCRFCNPPPKVYTCPACDWETEVKWKMQLHNDLNPKWCRDRAAKKVRKWSRQA